VTPVARGPKLRACANIETIDAELRQVSQAWYVACELGCTLSTVNIDRLLDERAAALSSAELPNSACVAFPDRPDIPARSRR
jgi:hypothetical protein